MKTFKFKSPIFQDAELEVDDFTEEVNNEELPADDGLSDFVGDEDITSDEVVKSLQVIDGIADATLEASGEENPDMTYDEVLDLVDETLESDEIPEEIANAVLEISIASDGAGDSGDVSLELGGEESNIVYGADDVSGGFDEVPEEEITEDTEVVSALILSNTKSPQTCPIVTKHYRLNSHWKDTNPYTRMAWDEAEKKVKAQLGHDPNTPKDWATVMAIAKNKYKSLQKEEEEAYTEAAFASVRRVLRALKSSLKKIYASKKSTNKTNVNNAVRQRIKSNEDIEGPTPPSPDTSTAGMDGTGGPEDAGLLGPDPGNEDNGGDIEGGSDKVILDEADYDFENGPVFEMELPTGDGDKQKMQFTEVSASLAVLKTPMKPIFSKLVGKVLPHKDGTATVFLRSGVFGLVAVNGKFVKGIRNSVYDAFARVPKTNRAVNSSFKEITLPGKDKFVISSVSSNRSLKPSKASVDIVASLERAYVDKLNLKAQYLDQRYAKVKVLNQSLATRLKDTEARTSKLDSNYQAKLQEEQFLHEMQQQHEAIQSSVNESTRNASKNIDFLSRMM